MKWFKFYGQDFLTDPKIKSLSVERRQIWVVLLCMANGEDKDGTIRFVREEEILSLAGIEFDGQTWHESLGFLNSFEKLGMITIDNENDNGTYDITLANYIKRQGEAKTGYERVKAWRARHKDDNNDNEHDNANDNTREDKIRIDKNREERETSSQKYLLTIPENDLEEFTKKFECTPRQVKAKAEQLFNWCKANGRTKKDYKAFLRNALDRDFGRRPEKQEFKPDLPKGVSEEGLKMLEEKKKELAKGMAMVKSGAN